MNEPVVSDEWIETHQESFKPPIANKLMFRNMLSVMFVGGPNARKDFHVDESSELFFQLRGNMEFPIVERGARKIIKINEGEVFLLPSRIPHSPQRPESGSVGLVIERARSEGSEFDCMRWYKNFDECDEVEFEQFFYCRDLGKDLVPVAESYKRFKNGDTGCTFERAVTPLVLDDSESCVPQPVNLYRWCEEHRKEFECGATIPFFDETHPDKEFRLLVTSEEGFTVRASDYEVFIYQISGEVNIEDSSANSSFQLVRSSCFVLAQGKEMRLANGRNRSLTLVVFCDPLGNKK
jgi:3-hydroxyanthranilate 3,4-dioxygenase